MTDDLNDEPTPDFDRDDMVCFKDYPDFRYLVMWVDGEGTEVDAGCNTMRLPTAALRKVTE